jgi:hypothetical protein
MSHILPPVKIVTHVLRVNLTFNIGAAMRLFKHTAKPTSFFWNVGLPIIGFALGYLLVFHFILN